MDQLVPILLIVASAGMLATAGGLAARHVTQRRRQAVAAEEHRIYQGVVAIRQAEPQLGPCPQCGGRRCADWKNSLGGATCLPVGSTMELPILGGDGEPGRHRPAVVVASLVPQRWSPLPMGRRVWLAPTFWAERLGRPIQLPVVRKVALP